MAGWNHGGGSGGGSGGGGCQYCYIDDSAPYANCFSGVSGLAYPEYANCVGTRTCWSDGSGETYCEPTCQGEQCLHA